MGMKRSTQGRQKIAMEKITNDEARNLCFSKRRNGLFTKAADLSTLCGAEVAILMNSPAGNPYSFGSPNAHAILNRFLTGNHVQSCLDVNKLHSLNQQCMETSLFQERANARKLLIEERIKVLVESNPICRMAEEPEELGVEQLRQVWQAISAVKTRAKERMEEVAQLQVAQTSKPIMNQNQYSLDHPAGPHFLPYNLLEQINSSGFY